MKKIFTFLIAILCFALSLKAKKPNIIFILVDDMGYGDVSALNVNSKINTPNIDRMANDGVVFRDAHSSSAVSTPSRYGILTGRYNWRSNLKKGVLNGYSEALIPSERTTMASMLKKQNYETACIGKWHLGWTWKNADVGNDSVDFSQPITNGPTERGFDYFYGFNGSLDMPPYVYIENNMPTSTSIGEVNGNSGFGFWRKGVIGNDFKHIDCLPNLTKRAVNYIIEKSYSDKPFFLYLPLPAPHTPILPAQQFVGKSGLNPYADFVLMVDDAIGEILNTVESQGIAENTIIVFTADNGCSPAAQIDELIALGHSPSYVFRGYKADLYDGGHHVPCIVQWKNEFIPHVVNQSVCLTDFMATFAALTGYQISDNEGEDSYNILPALQQHNYQKIIREAIVYHSINGDFAIKQGNWKLLLAAGSGGWSYPRPGKEPQGSPQIQLFNMRDDISEQVNLQVKYPEKVSELKQLLTNYIILGRSTPGVPQSNEKYPWEHLKWMDLENY